MYKYINTYDSICAKERERERDVIHMNHSMFDPF